MSLPSATRFGPYEIAAKIGEGGMGQVYRARDVVLKRDVAIKIIASPLAHDDEARVRFEREAQLVASLNHPHIAAVYGLVDEGGVRGLVMELIEGPTLAERLASGPLAPREALAIARDIAEALEAAHDKGIVHRDLKPANIKLTRAGGVKVLDFGIAKVLLSAAGDLANDPTIEATRAGTVVGTAAYMSPEQARGEPVDARTDIWAYGCVLHEMLTGHRAFAGPTQADTLAQVLKSDPDWTSLSTTAPPSVVRLIRRCLDKDPARRLRSVADARFEIEDASAAPEGLPSAQSSWTRGRVALAATGTAVIAALATYSLGRTASTRPEVPVAPMALGMAEPPGEFPALADRNRGGGATAGSCSSSRRIANSWRCRSRPARRSAPPNRRHSPSTPSPMSSAIATRTTSLPSASGSWSRGPSQVDPTPQIAVMLNWQARLRR